MTKTQTLIFASIASDAWDRFVTERPDAHVLQTSPWGALKAQFGWADERVGLTPEHLGAGAEA